MIWDQKMAKKTQRRKGERIENEREILIEEYLARLNLLRYQRNQEPRSIYRSIQELLSKLEREELLIARKIKAFNKNKSNARGNVHIYARINAGNYRKKGVTIILEPQFFRYNKAARDNTKRTYLKVGTAWSRLFQTHYLPEVAEEVMNLRKDIIKSNRRRKHLEKRLVEIIDLIAKIKIKIQSFGVNALPGPMPKKNELRRAAYRRRVWVENLSLKILKIEDEWTRLDASLDELIKEFNSIGKRRHHVIGVAWKMVVERKDPLLRISGPSLRIIKYPVSESGVKRRLVSPVKTLDDELIRKCQMSRHRRRLRKVYRGILVEWSRMRKIIDLLRDIKRQLREAERI